MPYSVADQWQGPTGAMQRLHSYLGQFANACDADFTTPLIGRGYRSDKDAGRLSVATSFDAACNFDSVAEYLRLVEMAKRERHGTYSRRPAFHVQDDKGVSLEMKVDKYFTPHPTRLQYKSVEYADTYLRALYDVSNRGRLRPLTLEDAVFRFEGRTGLGYPEFSSSKEFLYHYYRLSAVIRDGGYPISAAGDYPAVIGTRTQASGPGKLAKSRAVFQMSRVIGNIEKCIQSVLFDALRWDSHFSAWGGREYTNASVTKFMLRTAGKVLSLDFSNFDATVPFEVIDRVYNIISAWFTQGSKPLIRFCQEAFKRAGIIVPGSYRDGIGRLGGIPSGSVMTNLSGSLVNLWVMAYAAHRCGGRIVDATVQGDDGLYRFRGIPDIKPLADVLLSELGMVMSIEHMKSLYSDREVHYLQMVHHRDHIRRGMFVGVRPLMHVLNGAMSRENVSVKGWDDMYHTVRWLQQWENASDHPRFVEACDWLRQHDPNINAVVQSILRDDDEFLAAASSALSNGHGMYGKVPVRSLKWSSVLSTLCKLLGYDCPVSQPS